MKELFEQLENNYEAYNALDKRYVDTLKAEYYKVFGNEDERLKDLNWILKVQKRVLRMRYRILENIKGETIKQMQDSSVKTRELNLKQVA